METNDWKTIGIILSLIGAEGLIAGFLRLHLVLNPWINIILIIIGIYLIYKKSNEK